MYTHKRICPTAVCRLYLRSTTLCRGRSIYYTRNTALYCSCRCVLVHMHVGLLPCRHYDTCLYTYLYQVYIAVIMGSSDIHHRGLEAGLEFENPGAIDILAMNDQCRMVTSSFPHGYLHTTHLGELIQVCMARSCCEQCMPSPLVLCGLAVTLNYYASHGGLLSVERLRPMVFLWAKFKNAQRRRLSAKTEAPLPHLREVIVAPRDDAVTQRPEERHRSHVAVVSG